MHGKRHQDTAKGIKAVIPASVFRVNTHHKTCVCPAGKKLLLWRDEAHAYGKRKLFFEGRLTDCRHCERKQQCLRNPSSPDTRKGHGPQVSITIESQQSPTRWMRRRVDSVEGKQLYGHRMSVVKPVYGNIGTNKGLNRFSLRGNKRTKAMAALQFVNKYGNVNAV